jgi:hypothetical protein
MIATKFNTAKFNKEMNNIIKYSEGFLEGIQSGKKIFLQNLGVKVIEVLKGYIDSNARVNPQALHHVYEWYQTGIGSARLFDVNYTVSNLGLSFISEFSQSSSIKSGSRVPFYDKARLMENGTPLTIKPKNSQVLAFDVDGEQVFTRNPVKVENPGGDEVAGSFERVFDSFFNQYFTQAFLRSSGILEFLGNPTVYKKDLPAGKNMGRTKGFSTGYRWIANGGIRN